MAKRVDWYYQRKGWNTCARASKFLDANGVVVLETVPASRKLGRRDAQKLLTRASRLVAAKGRSVREFELGARGRAEAVDAMLGPTGNLRAPTLVAGHTVLVGFDEEAYRQALL